MAKSLDKSRQNDFGFQFMWRHFPSWFWAAPLLKPALWGKPARSIRLISTTTSKGKGTMSDMMAREAMES